MSAESNLSLPVRIRLQVILLRGRLVQKRWLIAALAVLAAHLVALWFIRLHEPAWLGGFRGNLVSSLSTGLLFVFVGLHLNQEIEWLIRDRARREKAELDIKRFKQFLRTEQYHDVRFPTLVTRLHPLGIEYTIEPVRKRHVGEMEISYVVRIRSVANEEVLGEDQLKEYDDAPIRVGEYYFVRFYNDSWHMGRDTSGGDWVPFYMSGKVGPVEHAVTANAFVGARAPEHSTVVCRFLVREDGGLMTGSGGCTPVEALKTASGSLLLRIHDSPPKLIDRTPPRDTERGRLVVHDLQGYFRGEARERFLRTLADQLELANSSR